MDTAAKYRWDWKGAGVDMPCAIEVLFVDDGGESGRCRWLYHPDYQKNPVERGDDPANYCPSARTEPIKRPSNRARTSQTQALYQFVREHSEDDFTELLSD
jgi:hypothetical protein